MGGKRILVSSQEGLDIVELKKLVRCEGVDGYTKVVCENAKSILSSKNIGQFCEMLLGEGFLLVHRSHPINLDFIIPTFTHL